MPNWNFLGINLGSGSSLSCSVPGLVPGHHSVLVRTGSNVFKRVNRKKKQEFYVFDFLVLRFRFSVPSAEKKVHDVGLFEQTF